ncbi:hypothetical protein F8B43_2548 [Methylorubrum populi]|uniref:Uncharacterized protein n=1 Tax=Methylorubrum populi TaxID=223967 RepID=A0A833N1R1_9HYPH|nr:hypothetical protein F8B43_2548 [Methylorubrum populi]
MTARPARAPAGPPTRRTANSCDPTSLSRITNGKAEALWSLQ